MTFIVIYSIVNVIAFVILAIVAFEYDNAAGEVYLFYPQLFEVLDDYEVNLAGKISAATIMSIVFAPAITLWYLFIMLTGIVMGGTILCAFLFDLFCKIFKKRKR